MKSAIGFVLGLTTGLVIALFMYASSDDIRYDRAWRAYSECTRSYPRSHGMELEDLIKCNNRGMDAVENTK
jgi:hypothetical protein